MGPTQLCDQLSSAVLSSNRVSRQGTLSMRQAVSPSQPPQFSMEVRLGREDMATAYRGTDAPLNAAVATSGRSPYTATASGVTDEKHHRLSISYSCKQCLNLGAWNVRTTNDSKSSIGPERATALICRELEKALIDICAISEVR